jgi:putative PIN family toxin of toxin-antitoxin system
VISIILDTNVFISGIFWSGPPFVILNAWRKRKIKLIYSADILEEYIRVSKLLASKYQAIDISLFMDLLAMYGEMHTPIFLHDAVTADPDDDKFIACALGARCKIIVSGDKHLLDVSGFAGIKVIKPATFVREHL